MTGCIVAGAKPQAPCGDAPHAAGLSAKVDGQGLWVVVGMCGAHSGHSLQCRQGRRLRAAQTCCYEELLSDTPSAWLSGRLPAARRAAHAAAAAAAAPLARRVDTERLRWREAVQPCRRNRAVCEGYFCGKLCLSTRPPHTMLSAADPPQDL